ncbi:MAG: hypothetical protein JW747_08220, partial [Candidatus Aminicenantes bacterium]|nr:hypothetical protein [Candidatus Aminicenantes bacterium]
AAERTAGEGRGLLKKVESGDAAPFLHGRAVAPYTDPMMSPAIAPIIALFYTRRVGRKQKEGHVARFRFLAVLGVMVWRMM